MDVRARYETHRDRLTTLVLDDPGRWGAPVPACPGWSVHDVIGHLVVLAQDTVEGRLPELDLLEQWRDGEIAAARDGMTADQVVRAADEPVDALVSRWTDLGDPLGAMLSGERPFPGSPPVAMDVVLVTDLVVHEQDIRSALGVPWAVDGPGLSLAMAAYAFGVDYRIRQLGLPALAVWADGEERVLGDGAPAAALTGDLPELVRVFAGRRSRAQILSLDWVGDPTPYVGLLPAYGERADDLAG